MNCYVQLGHSVCLQIFQKGQSEVCVLVSITTGLTSPAFYGFHQNSLGFRIALQGRLSSAVYNSEYNSLLLDYLVHIILRGL